MVNHGFEKNGYKWWLNDNRKGISAANLDLFPRYKLLMFLDGDKSWRETGFCCDTKREALEYVEHNYGTGMNRRML